MLENVIEFLNDSKVSYKQFDKMIEFYRFKDVIIHKQHFEDVCDELSCWFEKIFEISNLKISTYDIEKSKEEILYIKGKNFDEIHNGSIISFDFSKSYQLNGRIYFNLNGSDHQKMIEKQKAFFDYVLYELKGILSNYLAIEKLKRNSFIDDMTTLPNRRFLLAHLNSLLPIAKKENFEIAFLRIDIDRFKAVVEEFNYEIGNKVLKKLANTLKKCVGDTDILTTFEGENFMITMQDVRDEQKIIDVANKCIEEFAKEKVVVNTQTNQTLQKTICIGVSIYPKDGDDLDSIFKNTDIALEEAKNKGRGSYEFYKEEQNSAIDLF